MKIVFWLLVLILVILALRSKARVERSSGARRDGANRAGADRTTPSEAMVSCAQCGLYIPEPEAAREDGRTFCCEQHRRQYFARP